MTGPVLIRSTRRTRLIRAFGGPQGPQGPAGGVAPQSFTAAEGIAIGEPLAVDSSGEALPADATFSANRWAAIGIATSTAAPAASVSAIVTHGSLVPMLFASAPAGASNGSLVFLSDTQGRATLTPPTTSGNVRFLLGILQGADGADTTPDVLFSPQYISRIP
jgi:hypothetical protein